MAVQIGMVNSIDTTWPSGRQREEPAEPGGVMDQIASDMLQRPRRLHRRKSAVEVDQRIQHQEAENRT
jgi:hypothetical protein